MATENTTPLVPSLFVSSWDKPFIPVLSKLTYAWPQLAQFAVLVSLGKVAAVQS